MTLAQYDKYAQVLIKDGEVVDAWSETERGLGALLPLFGWEEGFFSFDVQAVETRTINFSLPVLQVRSAVYLEELKAAQRGNGNPSSGSIYSREVPSPEHILQVNQENDSEVTIQPEQWSILRHLVSGPRSVNEMAELTGTPLEAFVPVATQLVRSKMLRVLPPGQR